MPNIRDSRQGKGIRGTKTRNERYRLLLSGDFAEPVAVIPLKNSLSATLGGIYATFTRDGAGEATITDWEGLVKDVNGSEARFKGARRVENELRQRDFVTSYCRTEDWDTAGTATLDSNGVATIPAVASGWVITTTLKFLTLPVGTVVRVSATIEEATVTDLRFGAYNNSDEVSPAIDATALIGQRISHVFTTSVLTSVEPEYYSDSLGGTIKLVDWQVEAVTGQANQNPSEYVSVGVGTEAEENPSATFDLWTDPTVPDGWSKEGTHNATNFVEQDSVEGLHFKSDGTLIGINIPLVIGRVYAYSLTVSHLYGAGSVKLWDAAQIDFLSAIGTIEGTFRATTATLSLLRNGTADLRITNLSVKEINHGSNIDGVKYFDTLNYNTVVSNVVSRIEAPAGAETQVVVDPTMSIASTGDAGDGVEWTWSGVGTKAWQKDGNTLYYNSTVVGSVLHSRTVVVGEYYRIQYTLSNVTATIANFAYGLVQLPQTEGTHDVIVRCTASAGLALTGTGPGTIELDNVYITPLTRIPDDYLKGVLIEESSTNIFPYSEDFSNVAWGNIRSVDATGEAAPDGSTNGTLLTDDGSTGDNTVYIREQVTLTVASSHTISCFAKAGTESWFAIENAAFSDIANTTSYFDLTNGVVGTKGATHDSIGIEAFGNGWYRCWITLTTILDSSGDIRFMQAEGDNDTIITNLNGSHTIRIWGAQIDFQLPYPTSYIATSGGTATRTKETLGYTSPLAFQSTMEEYTLLCTSYSAFDPTLTTQAQNWCIDVYEDASNRIGLCFNGSGRATHYMLGQGTVTTKLAPVKTDAQESVTFAGRYDGAGVGLFENGVYISPDSAHTLDPILGTSFDIFVGSSYAGNNYSNSSHKGIKLFSKALSDAKGAESTS